MGFKVKVQKNYSRARLPQQSVGWGAWRLVVGEQVLAVSAPTHVLERTCGEKPLKPPNLPAGLWVFGPDGSATSATGGCCVVGCSVLSADGNSLSAPCSHELLLDPGPFNVGKA